MRIKDTYRVRKVAGENLIVEQGKSQTDMTKVISLNATALLLWEGLQGIDFSLDDAAGILQTQFGIAAEQAQTDALKWVESLINCDIIE